MIAQLKPCIPPLWARGGHLQTILGYALASPSLPLRGEKISIPFADGDTLIGSYYEGKSEFLVLLFHGLTGSTDSTYMHRSTLIALEQGHSVLLVNHRGCGEGKGLAKKPYHSGRGEDISEIIAFARKRYPGKKQIAMGFSLSANALLILLAGVRGEHKPDFAFAANGPIDLRTCSDYLKKGLNRLYDYRFVQDCKKDIYYKQEQGLLKTNHVIPNSFYLEDIDRIYTAPEGGFEDQNDYYAKCSAAPHLQKITTPTFLLTAKDDPFIVWQPYLNAKGNPHIQLHIEEYGGHLGYISKVKGLFGYERWLDHAVTEVLKGFTR